MQATVICLFRQLSLFGCVLGLLGLIGCSGYAGPRNVTNEDPAIKIPAIRRAVEAGDRSVVPQLLQDLDSNDSAIRFFAIEGLQRLTRQTHDYDWTIADRHERAPAVARWYDAMGLRPPAPPASAPAVKR